MCKEITIALIFAAIVSNSAAQDTLALWPIQGKNPGEGIIYRPQDYIHGEKVTCSLFISAEEGTNIVAPRDGIIKSCRYSYMNGIDYSTSFDEIEYPDTNIEEYDIQQRKYFAKTIAKFKFQFISMGISISCANRENIFISGIRPVRILKKGERLRKGEVIGKLGYCYKYIPQPCIMLERGINDLKADPMKMFGLASTFVPYKPTVNPNTKIPVKDLLADFYIFRTSLEQGYPGLNDYTSEENMNRTFNEIEEKIDTPMTSLNFRKILWSIVDSLRDSHLNLEVMFPLNSPATNTPALPIHFGAQNDSLIIFQTLPKYKNLKGKCIIEINGEKSGDIISNTYVPRGMSDGFITSFQDNLRLRYFDYFYLNRHGSKIGDSLCLKLADNQKVILSFIPSKDTKGMIPELPKRENNESNFECRKINPQTAYLKISTFDLTAWDLDSIGHFIKDISNHNFKNLIIDVRSNDGGEGTFENIFSLIAERPFKSIVSSMVKNNAECNFLKYCSNYGDSTTVLFPDYIRLNGKEGFYSISNDIIEPNDSIHFSGNVFALTDQRSLSAATMMASLVHKYKRGIIIGRETGSCYYQMNAVKFANVYLKNSELELRMPLVKVIFDDQMDKDIPWGRGVIPDYPLKWSYNELFCKDDFMLNYALKVIEKY